MKAWFVFTVDCKRYAVWANSIKEARQKLVEELGTGSGEFVGCQLYEMGKIKVDHYIYTNMSWFDHCICSPNGYNLLDAIIKNLNSIKA